MFSSEWTNRRLQCYDRWKLFSDQLVKNDLSICDNIWKIATGQGDDSTTGCLPDHTYFKEHFDKMIAIDLRKQQELMLIRKQYNKLILLKT